MQNLIVENPDEASLRLYGSSLDALESMAKRTQSSLPRAAYYDQIALQALNSGDIGDGTAAARQMLEAASRVGLTLFAGFGATLFARAADAIVVIRPENAAIAAGGLRDMGDSGQNLDQWLILGPLVFPLWRLGHRALAAAARQGYLATPFAAVVLPTAMDEPDERAELEREADSSTVDMSKEDLIDAVLVILDELAAEGEAEDRSG